MVPSSEVTYQVIVPKKPQLKSLHFMILCNGSSMGYVLHAKPVIQNLFCFAWMTGLQGVVFYVTPWSIPLNSSVQNHWAESCQFIECMFRSIKSVQANALLLCAHTFSDRLTPIPPHPEIHFSRGLFSVRELSLVLLEFLYVQCM